MALENEPHPELGAERHVEGRTQVFPPELTISVSRPAWMADQDYARIAAERTFDIDDALSGWLLAMIRERSSPEDKLL